MRPQNPPAACTRCVPLRRPAADNISISFVGRTRRISGAWGRHDNPSRAKSRRTRDDNGQNYLNRQMNTDPMDLPGQKDMWTRYPRRGALERYIIIIMTVGP